MREELRAWPTSCDLSRVLIPKEARMSAEIPQDWIDLRYIAGVIMDYHDQGVHMLSRECAKRLREVLELTDRRHEERRSAADRRDPDAFRDLVDEPLGKAEAEQNRRNYERRQQERRGG
jgi:hypothetical protein